MIITQTNLHFREGNSDKVYQVAIEKFPDGHRVSASWGRRGAILQTAMKSPGPTLLSQARKVHDRLVAAKLAKGYKAAEGGSAYQAAIEKRDTGIRCQLLNAVPEEEIEELLGDSRYVLQEKFDGCRLLVLKTDSKVIGINRRGFEIALPEPILKAVQAQPFDFLIDGEAVGEVMHVFDLLEFEGRDFRSRAYLDRYLDFLRFFESSAALQFVPTADDSRQRRETFESLRTRGAEGVVFKNRFAPYSPGRPASGGDQLKFKFVASASFLVAAINRRRSVALELQSGRERRAAGNVTIPPNHPVPEVGAVVEVRYLYAFRESGCIYQPVYLGPRTDVEPAECCITQLHYKSESPAHC